MSGNDDPRSYVTALLRRALRALPAAARAGGKVAVRVDAGYFAGELARVAHLEGIAFAIGAKRIAPLWRLLSGIGEDDWTDAIDMDDAQVAVADYRPAWWPAATELLIRRVRLDPDHPIEHVGRQAVSLLGGCLDISNGLESIAHHGLLRLAIYVIPT